MKKAASILIAFLVLLTVLGCNNQNPSAENLQQNEINPSNVTESAGNTVVRLAAMTGPTGMGLAKLLSDNDDGTSTSKYEFTLASTADTITPLLVKGELDIAAVPINLASILYNNTNGEIRLLAINTLGVLYILDNDGSISDISDLSGKTIYATGKGSTPEYTLRYLLQENGINPDSDVTIEWKSEPTEIVSVFSNNTSGIVAMLPQPYVTVAQNTVDGINIALDLTSEWDKLDNGSKCLTGCFVVRKAFSNSHPDLVDTFLNEYSSSAQWVNSNIDAAAEMMEKYGIVKAAIAKKAIPYCNITCIFGSELSAAESYLNILADQNPKAVGGTAPGKDFYYGQ